jgi:hypothetical protein
MRLEGEAYIAFVDITAHYIIVAVTLRKIVVPAFSSFQQMQTLGS